MLDLKKERKIIMLKFDENKLLENINGALALRPEIEKILDEAEKSGYKDIWFLGIGGTWASSLQVEVYTRGKSALPLYVENAAEYITTGNRKIGKDSLIVFSSVSGTTGELVKALTKLKALGAKVLGFVDTAGTILAQMSDWCISYPGNEQLKFFMLANYLMYKLGDFPKYEEYNAQMEAHLAKGIVAAAKKADPWAKEYAAHKYQEIKKNPSMPHYFVGSGTQWGATYSYAMCYWEEQLWIRTKSISAGEFFHGMLEIIEAETPVTLFIGEDEQRPLAERVAGFLPKVCRNYTVIDSKDYEMEGISEEFRGSISHLIIRAINDRVDVYMEKELCHPMNIRRYYRQFDY